MPGRSMSFPATASGSSPAICCASLPTGEPCASMPTASITESVPRPSVMFADDVAEVVAVVAQVDDLRAPGPRALEPLGHQVDGDHAVAAVRGDPRRHVADRPWPSTVTLPPSGIAGVLHGLPGGRQHVGEVDEAVVGRPLRAP